MPLVYACIAPHGAEIISQLARNKRTADLFSKTRKGMENLAGQFKTLRPDTVVIASPHNLRLWKHISIIFSENSTGVLRSNSLRNQREVSLSVKCDTKFARELYGRAKDARLPVIGANYGSFEGSTSDIPMDWGTMIPLWFVLAGFKQGNQIDNPRIVIVSPSREIPFRQNVAFGREIARLAANDKSRKVAFIASADQAHAHWKNGPYGFHTAAEKFDELVLKSIKENDLGPIGTLDARFIDDAKPDSVWQLAILHGILEECNLKSKLYSYQVPTYFGMICAGYS